MTSRSSIPHAVGQLVWSPADPGLGVGLVLAHEASTVRVRFARLEDERLYTTRSAEPALLRYVLGGGERAVDAAGAQVRVRRRVADSGPLAHYELEDGRTLSEDTLTPHVRDVGAKERLASLQLVHPEVVRARLAGIRLGAFGSRPGEAAVLGTRVAWLPHQVDVATAALGTDPVRRLLADEVGLGKTVEAAMIYAGLRQEGRAGRVLVLTPDSLCIQWLGEIYRKAHELLVLLDRTRLDDTLRDFPDLNPFEGHQRAVVSIDRLARDPALAAQAVAAPWDLIIVDEAHHLRWRPGDGGNAHYRLVQDLAARARHVLLLTATPMALDPAEYHALLRLLDPARFDDPARFAAVAGRAGHIRDVARGLQASLDAGTALSAELVASIAGLLADDAQDGAALAALAAAGEVAPGRRALAEPVLAALRARHGLTDYVVRNRRGPVGGMPKRLATVVDLVPSPAQESLLALGEQVMVDLALSLPERADAQRAVGELLRALWATPRALGDIVGRYSTALATELAPHVAAVTDSPHDADGLPTGDIRLRWLVEQIRALGAGDKLLVFVESAVAVRALRDALAAHLDAPPAMFHRELAPRDQDRQVAYFRDPAGPAVMLSTEAGGEGRNFQFCHRVVLYDLPWRPATVEQRVGRVDRVGQRHDVEVLVPFFEGGFEAGVLKVMREGVGVLDGTVGGIDHGLEFVADRLADLVLDGADNVAWRDLFAATRAQMEDTRARAAADVDPILDFASFSPARAARVLAAAPPQLGARVEALVRSYAGHSKLELHARGSGRVAVEGAPGAAGRQGASAGYVGTFSRTDALDHEDVEFLCFGHPLVEQALEWARRGDEAGAALALCRGAAADGAAFVWAFEVEIPDDGAAARAYLDAPLTLVAVDERGREVPEVVALLGDDARPLERMDAAPLRASGERWRRLVEQSHVAAEAIAQARVAAAREGAQARLAAAQAERSRHLARAQARALAEAVLVAGDTSPAAQPARSADGADDAMRADRSASPGDRGADGAEKTLRATHAAARADLEADGARLARALAAARPRLLTAVAVRLVQGLRRGA